MAPTALVDQATSQQLMAEAAQKLLDAVREHGATPSPFAMALLDLMDQSAKLQEFEEMMAKAQEEASTEEAKAWQQISLMSLSYCQKGLVEKQQLALQKVCQFSEQGASLFKPQPSEVAEAEEVSASEEVVSKFTPPKDPPPPPPVTEDPVKAKSPPTPPGVWVVGPPPGLAAPPGLEDVVSTSTSKSGTDAGETKKVAAAAKKEFPWRKAKKDAPEATSAPVAPVALSQPLFNFDAYSEDES